MKLPLALRSLRARDFRIFLTGFFFSQMGSQMQMVAINWQMYEMTHSAFSLGLIGLVSFLPILLLSMPAGLAADRFNRKYMLMATQVFVACVALALAAAAAAEALSPTLLFGFVALTFAGMAFFGPVRQSIVPDLVPQDALLNAVSLHTLARQSAVIIGPAIGGFLISFFGAQSVYMLNGALLLLSVGTLFFIRVPPLEDGMRSSFTLVSLLAGVRFIRTSPILFSTILLDFSATFFGSATSLLPIFAADILHVGARGLGALYAATSAGGVLAGLVLSATKNLRREGRVILWSVLVYGLATVGFGFSRSLYLTLGFLVLVGAGDMVSTIVRNTIRQVVTPRYLRGRMVGVNIVFAAGGPKLGDAEAGFLAAISSAPFSAVAGGIGTILATLGVYVALPSLRRFEKEPVTAEQ